MSGKTPDHLIDRETVFTLDDQSRMFLCGNRIDADTFRRQIMRLYLELIFGIAGAELVRIV